jgi:ribosomal protein S18 acetylase RimI-like enzyme
MLRRGTRADGVVADAPAEIQRIYVDGTWQGQGVAQTLVDACLEQARAWHCDTLWLGVWEKNARAIAFYEKIGLRVVGALAFMLGRDLQRDLVMARSLAS